MIYAVFSFPICSVYCNTLLANLNGRAYLRGEETVQMDMFKTSSLRVPNSISNDQQHGQVMLISSAPQVCLRSRLVLFSWAYLMMVVMTGCLEDHRGGEVPRGQPVHCSRGCVNVGICWRSKTFLIYVYCSSLSNLPLATRGHWNTTSPCDGSLITYIVLEHEDGTIILCETMMAFESILVFALRLCTCTTTTLLAAGSAPMDKTELHVNSAPNHFESTRVFGLVSAQQLLRSTCRF